MIRKVAAKSIGLYLNSLATVSKQSAASQAMKIFTRPFSGRYSDIELAYLKSATQFRLTTDEDEITYHHWKGSGKTVLFLHGWESNALRWRPYIERLIRKNLNIYAIDAPGHGLSQKNTINVVRYAKAIEALCQRHEPQVLIGHSLGGMACGYYLRHFDYTASDLVLLSTPSGLEDMMYRFFDMLSLRKDLMFPLEEIFLNRYDVILSKFSTANHLSEVGIEGIIIHDEHDDVTPYQESLQISRHWTKAKHITTKNLGHSLKDDRLIDAVCTYLSHGLIPEPIAK